MASFLLRSALTPKTRTIDDEDDEEDDDNDDDECNADELLVIEDLQPSTEYYIRVHAKNAVGIGRGGETRVTTTAIG